jgi:acyl-CoA hydrolase
VAQKADALPANVHVEEFYLQSGGALASRQAQSSYNALNYTHVARTVAARGIDLLVHRVAASADGERLSLSCNPDLSFDLLDEIARLGNPRPMLVAEVDPQLPYIGGSAEVPRDFFDLVVEVPVLPETLRLAEATGLRRRVRHRPVREHAGARRRHAADRHRLAVGCAVPRAGAAACAQRRLPAHAGRAGPCLARHRAGARARRHRALRAGLYGASEMVNDGFMHLRRAGILVRKVIDDEALMRRLDEGSATVEDRARLERRDTGSTVVSISAPPTSTTGCATCRPTKRAAWA